MSNTTLGVIMDPIEQINLDKDSTWAMMLAAQKRGWQVRYMQQSDLFTDNGHVYAESRVVTLFPGKDPWLQLSEPALHELSECDAILMRRSPRV